MRLIEADKVEQAIKDYWKAQLDKLPKPKSIEELYERLNRLDAILEHNDGLLKAIGELPSAQPKQNEMIKEIRRWINSGNRGNADYFIVDRIEEIINAYE